ASGGALLLDARTRAVIGVHNPDFVSQALLPPGSTVKPLVLASLLSRGKLRPDESWPCPGGLRIAGRSLDCAHPRLAEAIRPRTAIAYSCNCYVAHMAERFGAGELARELKRFGLSGHFKSAATPDATKLQALGEDGVVVTISDMAAAYRQLAGPSVIIEGLEDAVEYGTAQRARVDGTTVALKTGSVRSTAGLSLAWFVGRMPSRAPEVVVAVCLQGYSGGSDAAPIAGKILRSWRSGKL